MNQPEPNSQPKTQPEPAGYDVHGRPLYYHPPVESKAEASTGPQYVHLSRPLEPITLDIPEEIQRRHDESVKKYPGLNLSRGEYVVKAVKRHPIGLVAILGLSLFLILMVGVGLVAIPAIGDLMGFGSSLYLPLVVVGVMLMLLFALGGYIAAWVYTRNEFYLTNESVIQEIQTSLLSRHEQTVSLGSIEDASFQKHGILQHIFDYGMIRLSTEGDETTYRFAYAAQPKQQVAILNNAVEAFKNGRPVVGPDQTSV